FSLNGLGYIAKKREKYTKASTHYKKAFNIADSIGALGRKQEAAIGLSKLYEKQGRIDSALRYHKIFSTLKDTIFSEEKQKELGRQESKFKWKQKLLKKEEQRKREKAIAKEEQEQQELIIWSIGLVLLLVIIFAFILYNRFKIIRKQKQQVDEAYSLLDHKNRELRDSINYAQKIQHALLQSEVHETEYFPAHFVLFKPKDVVSGDFYWATEKNGHMYVAAMDCTGHGVPGAFLTMLGVSYLNEILSQNDDLSTGEVFTKLRERIIKELSQAEGGEEENIKDGAILKMPLSGGDKRKVQFTGANNGLYVVKERKSECGSESEGDEENMSKRKKVEGLEEIKPDKQAIGKEAKNDEPFSSVDLKLKAGDMLYIFSDGYADQFGGEKNKKFRYGNFKKLLASIHEKPMKEQ
ncbi:MAG: SpoIIE family protein phosphatase, partial [Flavobacteriales bacterium]